MQLLDVITESLPVRQDEHERVESEHEGLRLQSEAAEEEAVLP